MKVLILADINSPHILKWVSGLKGEGVELAIFSLTALMPYNEIYYRDIEVECMNYNSATSRIMHKAIYLFAISKIRGLCRQFNPDIVHAHYASSYGLLGAIARCKNFFISVWGTDVYVYPKNGKFYEKLLRFTFASADRIFSTSHDMAREAMSYTSKTLTVIPFGIDVNVFKPGKTSIHDDSLHFVTAKSLKPVYNIPIVIKAFKELLDENLKENIYLHIAGDGYLMSQCMEDAGESKDQNIFFHGAVPHADMPHFFEKKDVLINIPDSESFGVGVLEASACGLAIISTKTGGLKEVVQNHITGLTIDYPNKDRLIAAMKLFIFKSGLSKKMGLAGRKFVTDTYPWQKSVDMQLRAYHDLLKMNKVN